MFVIVGGVLVTVCVIGGFMAAGGHVHVLWQPFEVVIIGGAAVGSLVISCPPATIKMIIGQVLGTLKNKPLSKEQYVELLTCLYALFKTGKGNMTALEPHVEKYEESSIFKKYETVLHNHHAIHFICDTLKMMISASVSPYDLSDLLDQDMNSAHKEEHVAPSMVTKIGDAMPGLGIVAAVLGVVHTMSLLSQGKEVIGHSVAAALVGTFLGILISYGYMQPLASKMEAVLGDQASYFEVIKAAFIPFAKDLNPKLCIEFARRTVPPSARPSFEDMEEAQKSIGKAA